MSATEDPDRFVTRDELVGMTARMICRNRGIDPDEPGEPWELYADEAAEIVDTIRPLLLAQGELEGLKKFAEEVRGMGGMEPSK